MPAEKARKFNRVLLKLSGEVLQDPSDDRPVHPGAVASVAESIAEAQATGIQLGIVLGGGNIIRGGREQARGIGRVNGDYMGMLATVINGIALADALSARGTAAHLMTAVNIDKIGEIANTERAVERLETGSVVIFAGGTGNPFFTTDTAAALRATEISADALLKATKVDGVYDDDPERNENATRFDRLSYSEALSRELKIMDSAAFSLCMENSIPVVVFDFFKKGNLQAVLSGDTSCGTLVC